MLERVSRKIEINPGGTIYNRMIQVMAYADDVVLIGRSVQDLRVSVEHLE